MAATRKRKPKLSPAEVVAAVKDGGGLCGVNRASDILGIANANFKRYRDRLTEVPIEGARSGAFLVPEVEALAAELKAARSE